ncbi:SoxR reducing system RseC family protein [Marinospirillum minutulum]|uniref:SoxR reducing system RseC family protein n=1 Tax=Marinospirillum minutulum TaxID=64974 RepID=UPI00041569FE|nr:SoxR reducing system RseC family protein [Marinospirillum minutulum]
MTWVTQEAEVIAEQNQGQVQVKACASQGCGSCSLAGGCGQGILSRWLMRRSPSLTLHTETPLQAGDRILLGINANKLNRAAVLQFLLPLITLLAAALLAEFIGITSGLLLFLIALIGLASGLLIARKLALANQLELLRQLTPSPTTKANNNLELTHVE